MENEQIDKAIAAMGIAQNVKKEENVIVVRGGGSKPVGADMSGAPCGELNDDSKIPGQSADLEQVIHQREGNANCRGLERVTHCA